MGWTRVLEEIRVMRFNLRTDHACTVARVPRIRWKSSAAGR